MIALIYDAAADSSLWPLVSDKLASYYRGCVSGIMLFADPLNEGPVAMAITGVGEGASSDYLSEFHRHDVLTIAAIKGRGELVRSHEVIDTPSFERHAFWNDFSKPHTGAWHGMALGAVGQGHGMMIVCRPRDDVDFSDEDARDFQVLRGHLNRSLHIAGRFGIERLGASAFHNLCFAAIVIDNRGNLRTANQAAIDMLTRHGIAVVHGRRALPSLDGNGSLAMALAAVERHEPNVVARIDSTTMAASVFLRFSRLTPALGSLGFEASGNTILIALQESVRDGDDPGVLERLYGLTAAEAAVGRLLLQGLTASAIADSRGVSELTVRSQIEKLIAKTDSKNLRECVLRLDRALRF